MPEDYEDTVIIYGMYGGVQTPVAVDADGNLQAVLLGDYAGTPTQIAVDAGGKIQATLYGVHDGVPTPVYVDADGRIGTMATDQASVSADLDESVAWSASLTSLISNLNRIRYMLVSITGEAWGTASHTIAALWAKFHDTTGHAHSGSGSDGAPVHHGATTGRGDDDHTQYLLADGSRAMSGALAMGTHKITGLTSGTADKDAVTVDQLGDVFGSWATWSPTLGWLGATPANPITTTARWISAGKLVLFYLDIYSADSNACTGLTATLPAGTAGLDVLIPLSAHEILGTDIATQSQYPPAYNDTYVKATNHASEYYEAYFACDPSTTLTGGVLAMVWMTEEGTYVNQRFHIDLGSAKVITRVYYENFHESGGSTNRGVQNFTVWGSNVAASFAELTYATNTGWTQITASQAFFDRHADANAADPKYLTLTNAVAYRYYAFKFADNYGETSRMGVRRIELQVSSSATKSNPLAYVDVDGVDDKVHFDDFKTGVDGQAIRILVSGQYESA